MEFKVESLEDITFSVTYTLTYMNTSPTAVEGFSSEFTFTARASQNRDGGTWGAGGGAAPQIFSDQLTLSQREGGLIMPTTLLLHPPPIFRPSAIPAGRVQITFPFVQMDSSIPLICSSTRFASS